MRSKHQHKFTYSDKDKLFYYYKCSCGCRKQVERSLVDIKRMNLTTTSWLPWAGKLLG